MLGVALCAMLFSIYKLVSIKISYDRSEQLYTDVEEIFYENVRDTAFAEQTGTDDTAAGVEDTSTSKIWKWNIDKARSEICEDIVGYIRQQGILSYPIVQAEDNNKYLRTMLNGEYNVAGTIFVDCNFPEGLDGQYAIIYGHNMDDGSMFGSLSSYDSEDYYREHKTFEIYAGQDCYEYNVFSAFVTDADGYVYTYCFRDDEDFVTFANRLKARCPYQTDVEEITADDHVIVLSTCVDFHDYSYRYVCCLVRGKKLA